MYIRICILHGIYTSQSDGHVGHNQNMFFFEPWHCKTTCDLCLQKVSAFFSSKLQQNKNPAEDRRFDHAPPKNTRELLPARRVVYDVSWSGGAPNHHKSSQSLDHFSIETYGDLGIPHFKKPPIMMFLSLVNIRAMAWWQRRFRVFHLSPLFENSLAFWHQRQLRFTYNINGNFRILKWRYLPYIRPM